MLDKAFRGTKKLLEQFVDMFKLPWLVACVIKRVEVLLEQTSSLFPGFTIRHEAKEPVKLDTGLTLSFSSRSSFMSLENVQFVDHD